MIEYNRVELGKAAKERGFVRDTFEKVLRLKEILRYFNEDKYLKEHLVLKGGTAINMTIFNLPRLSVDIDMDFTPNYSKADTEVNRKEITERLQRYMQEEGYHLSESSRYSHSLDSFFCFSIKTQVATGITSKWKLTIPLRSHIFAPVERKIVTDAFDDSMEIRTLEPMEIFAAKVNALMSRAAARDLYDFNNMLFYGLFDESEYELFRKCIIFYASISAEIINKNI